MKQSSRPNYKSVANKSGPNAKRQFAATFSAMSAWSRRCDARPASHI